MRAHLCPCFGPGRGRACSQQRHQDRCKPTAPSERLRQIIRGVPYHGSFALSRLALLNKEGGGGAWMGVQGCRASHAVRASCYKYATGCFRRHIRGEGRHR